MTPTGSSYYHVVISAGSASFMVEVTGAAWAVDGTLDDKGLHFLGNVTPLYFRVPEQTATLHLSLEATPPGETAVATLYAPDGQLAAEFDCTSLSVDRRKIAVPKGRHGWWKLQVRPAPTGAMDDVWIKPGDELNGYFSPAPAQVLDIEYAR